MSENQGRSMDAFDEMDHVDADTETFEGLDDDSDLDGGVVSDDYDDLDAEEDDDSDDIDDDEDDYEDATADDIDFVVAFYREDSAPVVTALAFELANDLEELIAQLRRMPGDAGACGVVSISGEFFVLCRVRGRNVQVFLNDSVASNDWPIARDVIDFLGLEVPDPDDDSEPVGDFDILADQGISELDLEAIAGDLDEDSDQLVRNLLAKLKIATLFDKAISQG